MENKILIVDDARFARNVLKRSLAEGNYCNTMEARNAAEAVRMFEEEKPDLTFLDISLPDSDDLSLLEKLLGINPEAKIIMCSALGQDLIIEQALEKGAKGYLVKPFDQKALLDLVQETLV